MPRHATAGLKYICNNSTVKLLGLKLSNKQYQRPSTSLLQSKVSIRTKPSARSITKVRRHSRPCHAMPRVYLRCHWKRFCTCPQRDDRLRFYPSRVGLSKPKGSP